MPHVEIKHSNDVQVINKEFFIEIERIINALDFSAGACKTRSYPATKYLHTHCMIEVYLLSKPHRNETFSKNLIQKLQEAISPMFTEDTWLSICINYRNTGYFTNLIKS